MNAFETCTHPDHDHTGQKTCLDRAIGCSPRCLCCTGNAVPDVAEIVRAWSQMERCLPDATPIPEHP